jgi:hypothetical protein
MVLIMSLLGELQLVVYLHFLKEPVLSSGNLQQIEQDVTLEIVNASFAIENQKVLDRLSYSFPKIQLLQLRDRVELEKQPYCEHLLDSPYCKKVSFN